MVNKIIVITVYFGNAPVYFQHFLASCRANEHIDWLIITDIKEYKTLSANIHFIDYDLNAFKILAEKTLGFNVNISNPYKLCDFKPAYGLIFETYLKKYDYWGYCDIDLILGKIDQYLPYEFIKNYDVISTYRGFLSGPFCLFRNTESVKRLFASGSVYKQVFKIPEYQSFDENIQRYAISGISFRKIFYFIFFIFSYFNSYKSLFFSLKEFRYQFQWFVKRMTIIETSPADMTEIVFLAESKNEIKVFAQELLFSDSYLKRLNFKTWRIVWRNGILTYPEKKKQIFGFHFKESKSKIDFVVQELKTSMTITERGIFSAH
jgi:hypothetical protein